MSLLRRVGLLRDHDKMQTLHGAGEPEEHSRQNVNGHIADPDVKWDGETAYSPFNEYSPQTSCKRAYSGNDDLVDSDRH